MADYLIIGASSGTGKQLKKQLTDEGHRITGTYYKNAEAENTEELHYLNVLEENPSLDFIPGTLDGLVYCPGSIQLRPIHRMNTETFLEDYQLNVLGIIRIIQHCLPALKRSGRASVVLFSTVAVQLGLPFHSLVAASKGAVEGLTRAMAAEFAPSIRVNCIAPSLTSTPLAAPFISQPEKSEANAQRHPLKRIGQAEDLANAAQFLLSERSGWITGQVIAVDGGLSTLKV